jgi:pantoate--beta-alanine ligase
MPGTSGMLLLNKAKDIENQLFTFEKNKYKVGFVPTMGALHEGHLALIRQAKKEADVVVCSIFVNPTQFNDKKDFEKYPVTIEKDSKLLNEAGCDILFLPSVKEMYPDGFVNATKIDFGFLAQTLEGEYRPGHFDGMAQIVEKLLRIIKPDKLFMGQKDYQQQLIVQKLIKLRKLKTKLITCPTVREKDGLAMSSRNTRLDKDSRKLAVEISKTLKGVKAAIHHSDSNIQQLEALGLKRLSGFKKIKTEYFAIRNARTLKPARSKSEKLVALVAANIGGVRLIDNMLLY